MLSGDVLAARPTIFAGSDELRQQSAALVPSHGTHKSRQRGKSTTRSSTTGGPHAGRFQPPPTEQPIPPVRESRRPTLIRELAALPANPPFRFWVDEVLWSVGRVAVELVEQVLCEGGGVRTGGPGRQQERERRRREEAAGPATGPLGSQNMASWELLWTKSTYAIPAARAMRPGQLVSAIIGLNSLTMKKRLLLTLRSAYGTERACDITPRSFALPEELEAWAEWVAAQRAAGGSGAKAASGGDSQPLWILKTGQDAGKGLSLLPADQALTYARQQLSRLDPTADAGGSKRFQLQVAQLYIARPLLLLCRKFHLRLWVLVTNGHHPLRAYLHRRGLVLFSSEPYDPMAVQHGTAAVPSSSSHADRAATPAKAPQTTQSYDLPLSHVTNYARNANSLVWSLGQLAEHLGGQVYGRLWNKICTACARALAAASPSLAEAHAWLRPAIQEYGFQVMGADFLLDEQLHPWLLEFNSAPSIMVQHEVDETRQLVYEQKYGMLRDTWEIVRGRIWRQDEGGRKGGPGWGHGSVGQRTGVVGEELAALGDFEPLAAYML